MPTFLLPNTKSQSVDKPKPRASLIWGGIAGVVVIILVVALNIFSNVKTFHKE